MALTRATLSSGSPSLITVTPERCRINGNVANSPTPRKACNHFSNIPPKILKAFNLNVVKIDNPKVATEATKATATNQDSYQISRILLSNTTVSMIHLLAILSGCHSQHHRLARTMTAYLAMYI